MFSEKWGTTIDEAVELALQDLKLTREEVEIEVLEEPSKGFLNLRNKLAKVRVTKKESEKEVLKEEPKKVKEPKKEKVKEEKKIKKEKETPKVEVKTKEESIPTLDYSKKLDSHRGGDFLKNVTDKMGLNLNINVFSTEDNKNIKIELDGDNIGVVIGKKGQTLDALQYLTNLHVNNDKDRETQEFERVQIDANDYRKKREETLIAISEKLYSKCISTKRNVKFDSMNSYERKIVHSYLQSKENIKTLSEGREPYRRVVIQYVK